MTLSILVLAIALLSLAIWLGLIFARGQFWQANQRLSADNLPVLDPYPAVCAIVPARDEADLLPQTLPSLLAQTYPGQFRVILADDRSTDGTADLARAIAAESLTPLQVLTVAPLPAGWTGKLWAVEQGFQAVTSGEFIPDYLWLTDADIAHAPDELQRLVAQAVGDRRDLVSLMVRLRCQSFWEQLLVPAFVFFFQKLYPFPWVNQPGHSLAAAAGGCILVRRDALTQIGGIGAIRQALIDDCALAQAIKSNPRSPQSGRIWLGLTTATHSLRPYDSLATLWDMVARTAYTQLHYSPLLLLGTILGMGLIYLVPPVGLGLGLLLGDGRVAIASGLAWLLMAIAYAPTLRLYQRSPLWAVGLPAIASLYTLMTLDSARRHWQGRGGAWKGRVYSA
ncbi:MAG: glycosyltransferase [Spirulinaceae cyanobacterium SM2_1_0]|nr:glycosyltransferase [Spirulinaceae cyanobacterium SM2_1_0]